MIAHKSDVIKRFSKIIFLHKGVISGFNNYDNLMRSNEEFKNLINLRNNLKSTIQIKND